MDKDNHFLHFIKRPTPLLNYVSLRISVPTIYKKEPYPDACYYRVFYLIGNERFIATIVTRFFSIKAKQLVFLNNQSTKRI